MELLDLPIFPLGSIVFPGFGAQLHIFEERYKALVAHCREVSGRFGIVGIARGIEVGEGAEPYAVGTLVQITQLEELPGGRFHLTVAGLERFTVLEWLREGQPYLRGRVRLWPDDFEPTPDHELLERAGLLFNDYLLRLVKATGHEAADWGIRLPLDLPSDPRLRSLLVAALLQVPQTDKQSLLEAPSGSARLALAVQLIGRETTLMRTTQAAPPPNAAALRGAFSDN